MDTSYLLLDFLSILQPLKYFISLTQNFFSVTLNTCFNIIIELFIPVEQYDVN